MVAPIVGVPSLCLGSLTLGKPAAMKQPSRAACVSELRSEPLRPATDHAWAWQQIDPLLAEL